MMIEIHRHVVVQVHLIPGCVSKLGRRKLVVDLFINSTHAHQYLHKYSFYLGHGKICHFI